MLSVNVMTVFHLIYNMSIYKHIHTYSSHLYSMPGLVNARENDDEVSKRDGVNTKIRQGSELIWQSS